MSEFWLEIESITRVSSYMGLVNWIPMHLRTDVQSGTRNNYL